jgi:hypothetical protein
MVAAVNSALCAPIMRSHCRSHAVQLASVSRETLLACSPGYVVPAFRVAVLLTSTIGSTAPQLISITAAITTVVRKGRATPSTFDSDQPIPRAWRNRYLCDCEAAWQARPFNLTPPSSDTESSRPLDSPSDAKSSHQRSPRIHGTRSRKRA